MSKADRVRQRTCRRARRQMSDDCEMAGRGIFIDLALVRIVNREAPVGSNGKRGRPEVQVATVEAATGRASLVDLSRDEVCDKVSVSCHVELEVRQLRCEALVMAGNTILAAKGARREFHPALRISANNVLDAAP